MNFFELTQYITSLSTISTIDFFIVGYSLLGKPIYGAHVGSYTGNQILMEGAIHAREWITAPLLVDLCRYYSSQEFNGGMYFIFMANPDGVELVLDGVNNINCEKLKENLININDGSLDFSQWKANANAVDLNVNFDASWGEGTQNVFCIAPANFVGYYPNSEREVNSLINFTLKNKPNATISFHTKGEVIYYGFDALTPTEMERDRMLANLIGSINGYTTVKTVGSVGGYSDWVSLNLRVPAFTIEVGNENINHPIGMEYLEEIFEQNKLVPITLLNAINGNDNSMQTSKSFKEKYFLK